MAFACAVPSGLYLVLSFLTRVHGFCFCFALFCFVLFFLFLIDTLKAQSSWQPFIKERGEKAKREVAVSRQTPHRGQPRLRAGLFIFGTLDTSAELSVL